VRTIRPVPGGYEVRYVRHDPANEGGHGHERPAAALITRGGCARGGTYGTTFLLLRNRAEFPALSPALGTRFCGNATCWLSALRPGR